MGSSMAKSQHKDGGNAVNLTWVVKDGIGGEKDYWGVPPSINVSYHFLVGRSYRRYVSR